MESSDVDHNDLISPLLNHGSRLREGGEEAPTVQVQKNKIHSGSIGIFLFLLCFSVFFCNYNCPPQYAPEQQEIQVDYDGDEPNGPTLLSIVDETTNRLIPAANNSLYKAFKLAQFQILESGMAGVELFLDRREISFSHPLQVSWKTLSADNNTVRDSDILALYCHSHPYSPSSSEGPSLMDFAKPREVATIAQVKSSSRFHNPIEASSFDYDYETTWYIPSFPTIREKKCHFRLWRDEANNNNNNLQPKQGSTTLSLLSVSEDLLLPPLETPTAIHLSLTNNPKEMVVQFTTGTAGQPLVEILHPNNTISLYMGTSTTYSNEDLCQAPANSTDTGNFIPPGNLHTVLVDNLVPNMEYKYRVGLKFISDENNVRTLKESYDDKYYSFFTAPPIGSNDEPFAFIAYGDQGCPDDGWAMGGNMSTNMIKRELDEAVIPIKAVHHFGDLSYARGNAHLWDAWHDMIFAFTPRVPLLVGVGNHEYDHTAGGIGKDPSGIEAADAMFHETADSGFHPLWGNFGADSGGECGVPTSKRFYTPQNGNGVFWYSYDIGLVHTIMISSEHSLSNGSRQYKWLEEDLKGVDRDLTPWIIIESHRPMYMGEFTSLDQYAVEVAMRHEFENLLIQYEVDLFLSGHFHSYFRSCKGLYKSKCNNGGLTHIVVGTAGAKLDEGRKMHTNWTETFIKDWGYGKIVVYNSTAIHWSFISSHGENEGKTMDELWIKKEGR